MNNTEINNVKIYTERMSKSILDKLFFVDKIYESVDNVIDFGCADGALIKTLKDLFPDWRYIGYDNSEDMLCRAREKCPSILFTSDWNSIDVNAEKGVLNLSSVIHEVYSYGTEEDIAIFWNRIFKNGFKYICIRDMVISEADCVVANPCDIRKVAEKYPERLASFENEWGSIEDNKNFIHFLLKYRYVENWERENKENYLPISKEELKSLIPDEYEIVYEEYFVLPFVKEEVRKDFGIELKTPTHLKMILKRKDNNNVQVSAAT